MSARLNLLGPGVLGSSTSANLVTDLSQVISDATVSGNLNVIGRTTLRDLGITGDVVAGVLTVHGLEGSINTLAGDLKLQDEGLGGLDILAGKVKIDTNGNVNVLGTITANVIETKQLTVLGTQSIGSSTILLGSTSAEIDTQSASQSSKIFITPTTLTNQTLTVIQKGIGKFIVGILTPAAAPINFDWWIVGNK